MTNTASDAYIDNRCALRHRITLIGGFVCMLSTEESNAWHLHITQTVEYARHFHLRLELTQVIHNALYSKESIPTLETEMRTLETTMFDIGEAWHKALIATYPLEPKSKTDTTTS